MAMSEECVYNNQKIYSQKLSNSARMSGRLTPLERDAKSVRIAVSYKPPRIFRCPLSDSLTLRKRVKTIDGFAARSCP